MAATRPKLAWGDAATLNLLGQDVFSRQENTENNTVTIEALDLTLNQGYMPANRHLIVRGDHITISGSISLPGYNVTIMARQINCQSGATISTTGNVGAPSYTIAAAVGQDGAGAGQSGVPAGGRGQDGGQITIIAGEITGSLQLDASGGAGGNAQDGGIGQSGSPGPPAYQNHPGGPGTPGHVGGLAGVPGAGGNGGAVRVGALQNIATASITGKSSGGAAGNPGHNGASGAGGPGGPAESGTQTIVSYCPGSRQR